MRRYWQADKNKSRESGNNNEMAARAIRTSGDEIPGPISTVIQVIAYYR
ncbi:TPA: hypothetical protein ACNVTG_002554 [Citrobacter amalonaticus]